ncbi:response regulator transcription factor [Halanaerobaculum tunisiense]
MSQILIVDDEDNILELLKFNLQQEDYHPVLATDGQTALAKLREDDFDLVVLDIMLPQLDGYELCQRLKSKEEYREVPIIFVSAKDEIEDIVQGLNYGAADYVKKPFSIRELLARIKAVLTRKQTSQEASLQLGAIKLTDKQHQVLFSNEPVDLTYKEYYLLKVLLTRQNQVCSRQELLMQVWGSESKASLRTIDVHIRNLRQKLQEYEVENPQIKTIRGRGYSLQLTD